MNRAAIITANHSKSIQTMISLVLSHYLTNVMIFYKKMYFSWNVCFHFLYKFYPKLFSTKYEFSQDIITNLCGLNI